MTPGKSQFLEGKVIYWLVPAIVVLILLGLFVVVRQRKSGKPDSPATYGGPIRFTDPSGRNMKIVQKDDGTFDVSEE
ncbi:MAG TPA: hypothetical protein PKV86_10570 [Syntrophobacteraceae bacterium]|nr:hypothetical protein [Syntrophobacteraceae bacterium]